ncbi:MAG: epoxide hydrolase 4 [Chloroflexota bacterium]|nr:epoxide hydrolase 4 [Chloroflexota bacterium]
MSDDWNDTMITTNGVALHVVRAGPEDGPAVILLHGFPEPWLCWRHQIGPLAEAGLRVLAPDQRGYNTSAKPPRVSDYALDVLAADVIGLIDASGRAQVTLVGHDWGGVVAWWVALRHPERVERLAILNAPHPAAFRRYLRHHPAQLLRSWYVFFFQLPRLPEANFRRANWHELARALRTTSRPGAFSDEDLEQYRRAWSEPGAITSMIHWYRAALRYPAPTPPDPRIHVPTLLLWGNRDAFIQRGVAEASLALCDDGRLEWFEEATHWLHHEEPERVNRLLLEFLGHRLT